MMDGGVHTNTCGAANRVHMAQVVALATLWRGRHVSGMDPWRLARPADRAPRETIAGSLASRPQAQRLSVLVMLLVTPHEIGSSASPNLHNCTIVAWRR